MRHLSACPSLIVHSTAVAFGTGSAPGKARHTGHVRVFGSPPKPASQSQNIFVRVFNCTWISRPITGSHSATEELLRLRLRRVGETMFPPPDPFFGGRRDPRAAEITACAAH